MNAALQRAADFCARYGLDKPILLAPMAGACPASLSIAVANAGGMGAMGALVTPPDGIRAWVKEFRSASRGSFQLNVWVPDPKPRRDAAAESAVRAFLEQWGPAVPASAADVTLPDFNAQCDAFLEVTPRVVSSIMGVYLPTRSSAGSKTRASPGLRRRRRWPRRRMRPLRAPTRSSRRATKPAATEVLSITRARSARASDWSHSFRGWSIISTFPSLRPGELATAAVWPPR
jgi:hypothetical protein